MHFVPTREAQQASKTLPRRIDQADIILTLRAVSGAGPDVVSSSPCFIANTPAGVSVNAVGVDIRPLGIANLEYGENRLCRLCTQRTGLQGPFLAASVLCHAFAAWPIFLSQIMLRRCRHHPSGH